MKQRLNNPESLTLINEKKCRAKQSIGNQGAVSLKFKPVIFGGLIYRIILMGSPGKLMSNIRLLKDACGGIVSLTQGITTGNKNQKQQIANV